VLKEYVLCMMLWKVFVTVVTNNLIKTLFVIFPTTFHMTLFYLDTESSFIKLMVAWTLMTYILALLANIKIAIVADDAVIMRVAFGKTCVANVATHRIMIRLIVERLNHWHWISILGKVSVTWWWMGQSCR